MIKKITKKIIVEKEVCERIICDCCGKEISGDYYSAFTGHNGWGNDSIDSYEHPDYCSSECLVKAFTKFFTDKYEYGTEYYNAFFNVEGVFFNPERPGYIEAIEEDKETENQND